MSNTKHTPGPWRVKPGKVSWNIHSHKPQQAVLNSTLTGQFDVTSVAFGRTEEETESNAKLIAAAPELLEAATKMLGIAALMLPYCQDNETKELFKRHFHICQEVIKKVIE